MIFISKKQLNLLHADGFVERFHHYCNLSDTREEAYEKVEQELEQIFGIRRYKNYDSFRTSLYRSNKLRAGLHKRNISPQSD